MNIRNILLIIISIFLLSSFTSSLDYTQDNTLWYKFVNASNSTEALLDLSPNNFDLTNVGSTSWSSAGFDLDGTDDELTVGDNITLDLETEDQVLCAWVNFDTISDTANRFIQKGTSSDGGYKYGMNSANDVDYFAGVANSISKRVANGEEFTDTTNTHQWCAVLDRSDASKFILYLDGVAYVNYQVNQTVTTNYNSAEDLRIGYGEGNFWNGLILSVQIWKAPTIADNFNSTNILALYNLGAGYNPYSSPLTNFTITSNVNTFYAYINGTEYNTTTGTITTDLLLTDNNLYNLTVSPDNLLLNDTINNINVNSSYNYDFSVVTVTANDTITNNAISGLNVTFEYDSQSYSKSTYSAGSSVSVNLIKDYEYDIMIESDGYNVYENITTPNTTTFSYNAIMSSLNSVYVRVYDTNNSNTLFSGVNITTSFILGANITAITNTSNPILFSNLTPGTYTVNVEIDEYEKGVYEVTVGNNSFQYLDVYMVLETDKNVIFTYLDYDAGTTLEGVTLTVEQKINSTFFVISVLTSDVSGRTLLPYNTNGVYRFTTSFTDYASKVFVLDPIIFTSYNIRLQKAVTQEDDTDYSTVSIELNPSAYYNNEENEFSMLLVSPIGNLLSYEYTLTTPNGTFTDSGINAYGERLTVDFNITNALITDKIYLNYSYIVSTGIQKDFFKTYTIGNPNSSIFTTLDNKDNKYNLPLIDRLMIITIIIIIAGGLAYGIGGVEAAGSLALFIYAYFIAIEFIPKWSVIIPMVIIFSVIAMRD